MTDVEALRQQIIAVVEDPDRPQDLLARVSADGLVMKFNSMVPDEFQIPMPL